MLKRLCAVLSCVVLMVAAYARIEAMKAENARRLANGEDPVYVEDHFRVEAEYLGSIAAELRKGM